MESHGPETKEENIEVMNSNVQDALEPGEICSSDNDVDISSSVTSSSICDAFDLYKDTSIEIENCCIEKTFTHEGRRVYLKNSPLIFIKKQIRKNSEMSYLKKMKGYSNPPSEMEKEILIKMVQELTKKIELNLYQLKQINNCITKSNKTVKMINKYKNELRGYQTKQLTSNQFHKSTHAQEDAIAGFSDRKSKEDLCKREPKLQKTSSETSIISHSSLKCSSDISNKSSDNSKSFSTRKTYKSNNTNMRHKSNERSSRDGNLQYDSTKNCHNRYWHFKHKKYFNENSHSTSRLPKTSASENKNHRRNHRREFLDTNNIIESKRSEGQAQHNYFKSSNKDKHSSQNHKRRDEFHSKVFDNHKINKYQSYISKNSVPYKKLRSPSHRGHQFSHCSEQYNFYDEQYNKYLSANDQHEFNYFSVTKTKYSEKPNLYSNYINQESNIPIVGSECSSKCQQIQSSHTSSLSLVNEGQHTNVSMGPNFITTQSSSKSESSLKVLVQPPPPGVESPSHLPLSTYISNKEMEHSDMHHFDYEHSQFSTYSSKCKNSYDETSLLNCNYNKSIIEKDKGNNRNQNKMPLVTALSGRNESFKSLGQSDSDVEHWDNNTNQRFGITNKLPLLTNSESQDNLPKINNSLDTNEQIFIRPQNNNFSDVLQPRYFNFDEREKNDKLINIYNTTKTSTEELCTMPHESQDSYSILTRQSTETQSGIITLSGEDNNNQRIPVVSVTQSNLKESVENILTKPDDSQNEFSTSMNHEYNLPNNVHKEFITVLTSHKMLTSESILPAHIVSNTQDPQVNSNIKQQETSKHCMENIVENLCSPQTENRLKYVYQKIYNINIYPEDSKKGMGQISEYKKLVNVFGEQRNRNVFYAYHKNEAKPYNSNITFQKSEQSVIDMKGIKRKNNIAKMICNDLEEKQSDPKEFICNLPTVVNQSTSLHTKEVLKDTSANEESDALHIKNKEKVDVENNTDFSPINMSEGVLKPCRSFQFNRTTTCQPNISVSLSKQDDKLIKKPFTVEMQKIFKKTATKSKNYDNEINMTINENKNIGNYSIQQMTYKEKSKKFSISKGGLNSKLRSKKQKVSGNKMSTRSKQKKNISNCSLCWHCRSSTKSVGCFANISTITNN